DALMDVRELSRDDQARIREQFAALEPGRNSIREAGKLLSELTDTAAVVVAPRAETMSLKHLRFIRISPEEILAVLVMSDGAVHNRFLRVGVAEAELQRVHNLLDDVIEGRTLGELRDLSSRRLATERVQHDDLRRRAFELGGAAVTDAAL